ncbi:PilZ domain-containing protein [Geothermobacter ehrlichii]|nr:PilZ domain-containing protein [Geothermobacter ehrlichii]
MPYSKYFRPDQKLLLRPLRDDQERIENLSAYVVRLAEDVICLYFPYENRPGEEYPFEPEMPVELVGEALGLGIRITGNFQRQLDRDQVEIRLNNDLQAFQRRIHPRGDVTVGLRYTRGHGALRTFRSQWEKNVRILAGQRSLEKLGHFPRVAINLGTGGLRFAIKSSVQVADLCMVLIQLQPENTPICALAEVVWIAEEDDDQAEKRTAGLQFINILKSDQQKIETFLRETRTLAESPSENPS